MKLAIFYCCILLIHIESLAEALTASLSTAQSNVHHVNLHIPQLNRDRTIRIYLPPDYSSSSKEYPVLYMHDAQNLFDDATSYVGEWGVDETLNKLYTENGLGLIIVGIDHGGKFRINELNPYDHPQYGQGEGNLYIQFIVETLMPYIESHYRVKKDKGFTSMAGSSLGGLITLYAAHQYPEIFQRIILFSPAYWIAPKLEKQLATQPLSTQLKIYTIMGEKEGKEMIVSFEHFNRLLKRQVRKLSIEITPNAKHHEAYWRAQFEPAIRWLYNDISEHP
jgi:predicted alpha/beta superfamily hydrolase